MERSKTKPRRGLLCLCALTLSLVTGPCLNGQSPKDARTARVDLKSNNAVEVAGKLDGLIPGIVVKALSDNLILLTYTTEVPPENLTAMTAAALALDGKPPELSSGRVVRLFNLHDAATVAASLKIANVDAKSIGDDLILLTGLDNGREEGIEEAKRYIALLDSPRPEVTLNVWSVQISSKDRATIDREGDAVRHVVALHNQQLRDSLEQGWKYLTSEIWSKKGDFYDSTFHDYLTHAFVSTQSAHCPEKDKECEARLRNESGGGCTHRYCLGYPQAFEPLRPSLTDLLLTVAAANDPASTAKNLVDCMESTGHCRLVKNLLTAGTRELFSRATPESVSPDDTERKSASAASGAAKAKRAAKNAPNLGKCFQDYQRIDTYGDCELKDFVGLSELSETGLEAHSVKFACFRQQLQDSMGDPDYKAAISTSRLGLLRSAIADYLFQYKFANQYPHEFISYDYSKSAQILDSEFDPLLVAFNRDVGVFLRHLQAELECPSHGKTSLRSNGIITVRTISNQKSTVDTKTANYFDVTPAPSLTDLVAGTKTGSDNVGDVIAKQISPFQLQAIMAGLNAVKPVTSKIGRGLSLEVTPRSLLGASATELEVTLKNNEGSDGPKLLAPDNSDKGEDAVSRVAQHDVTTHVRVEALKLFELSSFSATLNRGRKGFPILPPLVELPLVGSFARIPLPPGTMFHRSFAIISAVIVPTASDLANGIAFSSDASLGECAKDQDISECDPHDPATWPNHHIPSLGRLSKPIRVFHGKMLSCLASDKTADCAKDLSLDQLMRNRGVSTVE